MNTFSFPKLILFAAAVCLLSACGKKNEPPRMEQAQEDQPAIVIDDAAVVHAQEVKQEILSTEEQVFACLQRIDGLIERYDPRDLNTEELLVKEYRDRHLPLMRQWATNLLGAKNELITDWSRHIQAVKAGPASFRKTAALYRSWAQDQKDSDFRPMYRQMAEISDQWVVLMENRLVLLQSMNSEFAVKAAFLEDSVLFLARLDTFLQTIPDPARVAEMQAFLKKLDRYIEGFRKTLDSFKNLSDKMQSSPYALPREAV